MSGYNSRINFDKNYYNEFVNQQTNVGEYRLNKIYAENDNKCYSLNGPRQNNYKANTEVLSYNLMDRKEIENYLRNLDVYNSKYNNSNTLANKKNKLDKLLDNKNINNYFECDKILNYNYTRLNNDILDNKSVNINRFEYPIIEPSKYVYYGVKNTDQKDNERNGINSRLKAKDNYKKNKN